MTRDERLAFCEAVYRKFHDPRFISPDPLEIVLACDSIPDREIVAFIVSSLSLGRVGGILTAARHIIGRIEQPRQFLEQASRADIAHVSRSFRYRFFRRTHLEGLLIGLQSVIRDYGSLENCLAAGLDTIPASVELETPALRGLEHIAREIAARAQRRLDGSILVARPSLGSACKRLLLFLRWMVRSDEIDPGGWQILSPSDLLVPVDTHMLAVCRALGIVNAAHASRSVVLEVTRAFSGINPADPVRYDFSLTRLGIHPDGRVSGLWPGLPHQPDLSLPA